MTITKRYRSVLSRSISTSDLFRGRVRGVDPDPVPRGYIVGSPPNDSLGIDSLG